MPAVIDVPARVDHDAYDLQIAPPKGPTVHRGFWYTVRQYMRRHSAHTSSRMQSASRASLHPTESPMARLAQEHPTLYLLGFCGIHSG